LPQRLEKHIYDTAPLWMRCRLPRVVIPILAILLIALILLHPSVRSYVVGFDLAQYEVEEFLGVPLLARGRARCRGPSCFLVVLGEDRAGILQSLSTSYLLLHVVGNNTQWVSPASSSSTGSIAGPVEDVLSSKDLSGFVWINTKSQDGTERLLLDAVRGGSLAWVVELAFPAAGETTGSSPLRRTALELGTHVVSLELPHYRRIFGLAARDSHVADAVARALGGLEVVLPWDEVVPGSLDRTGGQYPLLPVERVASIVERSIKLLDRTHTRYGDKGMWIRVPRESTVLNVGHDAVLGLILGLTNSSSSYILVGPSKLEEVASPGAHGLPGILVPPELDLGIVIQHYVKSLLLSQQTHLRAGIASNCTSQQLSPSFTSLEQGILDSSSCEIQLPFLPPVPALAERSDEGVWYNLACTAGLSRSLDGFHTPASGSLSIIRGVQYWASVRGVGFKSWRADDGRVKAKLLCPVDESGTGYGSHDEAAAYGRMDGRVPVSAGNGSDWRLGGVSDTFVLSFDGGVPGTFTLGLEREDGKVELLSELNGLLRSGDGTPLRFRVNPVCCRGRKGGEWPFLRDDRKSFLWMRPPTLTDEP
jgi:hypothetical protein